MPHSKNHTTQAAGSLLRLHNASQVHLRQGSIAKLALQGDTWHVSGEGGALATAERVFLATGSHPRDDQLYPGPRVLPLDDALIPSKLRGASQTMAPHRSLEQQPQQTRTSWRLAATCGTSS